MHSLHLPAIAAVSCAANNFKTGQHSEQPMQGKHEMVL
jgi:hypothetical protein